MTSAVCSHLTRKFGKVFTTCDSTNSLVGLEPPSDEVFEEEYYLGPPGEVSTSCCVLNPFALRKAKIVCNFGLSECK